MSTLAKKALKRMFFGTAAVAHVMRNLRSKDIHYSSDPKVGSPEYQPLFDSNPYRQFDYHMGAGENLLRSLGFRTKFDTQRESFNQNAAEYDNQVVGAQFENEYNSPAQQAAREKAAGLNTALSGLGASEPSAGVSADETPPTIAEGVDGSDVSNFVGSVLGTFTNSLGIMSALNSVKLQKLEIGEKSSDTILNTLEEMIGTDVPAFSDDEEGLAAYEDYSNGVRDRVLNALKARGVSKSVRGMFSDNFKSYLDGLAFNSRAYSKRKGLVSDKVDYGVGRNNPLYSDNNDFNVGIDAFSKALGENMKDKKFLDDQVKLAQAQAALKQAENDYAVQQSVKPGLAAAAINSGNAAAAAQGNYDASVYNQADSSLGAGALNARNEQAITEADIARYKKIVDECEASVRQNEIKVINDTLDIIDELPGAKSKYGLVRLNFNEMKMQLLSGQSSNPVSDKLGKHSQRIREAVKDFGNLIP